MMEVRVTENHWIRQGLDRLTRPVTSTDAPEALRSARLVMSLILSLIAIAVVGGIVPILLPIYDDANRFEGLTYSLVALPFLLAAYWLARSGRYLWAIRGCVAGLVIGIALFSIPTTDLSNIGYLFFMLLPIILASIFLSVPAIFATLLAAVLAGFLVQSSHGILINPVLGFFDLLSVVVSPSLLIIIGKVHRDRIEEDRRLALLQKEMTFNLVAENAGDAVLLINPKGEIVYVNPGFAQITGQKPEDFVGLSIFTDPSWHSLIVNGSPRELMGKIEEAKHSRAPVQYLIQLERPDKSRRWIDIVFNSIVRDDGAIVGLVCIGRDVTERVQITQAQMDQERLSVELQKERELGDLKSLFMTTVSHEFRTPLATILSSVEMLDRYSDRMTPERRAEGLTTIREQVDRLRGMLSDMTMLLQIQTSGIFQAETIDLHTFLEDLLAEFRQHIAPDHVFTSAYGGQIDAIGADRRLLRNILANLLGNAAKYSAPGTRIELNVSRAADRLNISVTDQGRGIPKTDRDRMFDAFYRGMNVDDVNGTGLGLKIVRDSVALYNGSIEVESAEGLGTTFTVSLPILIV